MKRVLLAVFASFALLLACSEQKQQPTAAETKPVAPAYTAEPDKGVAAKAAEGVERAAESTKETAEDVAEKTGAMAKEEAKDAGANIDKAAENTKEMVKGAFSDKEKQP